MWVNLVRILSFSVQLVRVLRSARRPEEVTKKKKKEETTFVFWRLIVSKPLTVRFKTIKLTHFCGHDTMVFTTLHCIGQIFVFLQFHCFARLKFFSLHSSHSNLNRSRKTTAHTGVQILYEFYNLTFKYKNKTKTFARSLQSLQPCNTNIQYCKTKQVRRLF